jgi:hypothetical protein
MARLNWEARIYREQGFQDLMIAVGSRHLAKGIAVELFELAQEFWYPGRKPIPHERFKAAGLPECLYAPGGLCELTPEGVYCRGSKDAFQWLFDAQAAGEKSAEVRRAKNGTAQPKKPRKPKASAKPVEPPLNDLQPPLNQPEGVSTSLLSSPFSLLSSPSSDLSSQVVEAPSAGAGSKPAISGANEVIGLYCDEWRERYRMETSPPIKPADAKRFKELVQTVGLERAKALVRAYLAMPDAWYVTKRHDIWTLMSNLNAVSQFADSGRMITRAEVNELDSNVTNMQTMRALREGKI